MAKQVDLNVIKDILNEYSSDIQEAITESAFKIAENGKKQLIATRNTYQVRTGKYNKGWRVDKRSGKGYVHATIHNSTNWQLTHLLEKPHLKRNGKGYTKAFVHIAPVEEKCITEYKKDVEQIIKNGG